MERLEARICELAGHLTAATCQFLLLIADFDARKGWADWEMPSCAAWLSWKCQIASGTAREQVRVARALGALPAIAAEFAAGRLSYAKVRALTRIATPQTEHDLLEMATPMTANQMERFAQAHRRVTEADRGQTRPVRQLTWNRVKDLDYVFRAILPAEGAAVVLQALRAARNDLEHPHDQHDNVSAETSVRGSLSSTTGGLLRLFACVHWPGRFMLWLAWLCAAGPAVRVSGLAAGMVNSRAEAMASARSGRP